MSIPDHVLRQRIDQIFQNFDRDGSGYLDVYELQRFVNTIFESVGDSERLNQYEARQFLNQIDHNNDQKCSKEEVFRLIKAVNDRKQQRQGYGRNQNQGYGNQGYGYENQTNGNQGSWGNQGNYGNQNGWGRQNNNGWGNNQSNNNQNGWGNQNNSNSGWEIQNNNNNGWGNEGNNQEGISKPRYGASTPNQGYGSGSNNGRNNSSNGW